MIARIKTKYNIYDSFVFAYKKVNYKERIIILDENLNLICLDCWSNHNLNYLIIDNDTLNYKYVSDKFISYWEEKDIFNIVAKKKYSEQMLEDAIKIGNSMKIKEWKKLEYINDLSGLMNSVYGFHDSYVVEINTNNEYTEILIDTTWSLYIKLRCYGVIRNDLSTSESFYNASYEILEDSIKLTFDSFNRDDEVILEANKMEVKLYHEFEYKFINYEVLESGIKFYDKDEIVQFISYDELKENINNVGIINITNQFNLVFFLDDYMLKFVNTKYKKNEELYEQIYNDFISKFNEKDLKLFEIDYFASGNNYGEILYQEKYSKLESYLETFKIIGITAMVYVFLFVTLLFTSKNTSQFIIFGLGVTGIYLLFALLFYLLIPEKYVSEIILYENAIVQYGMNSFIIYYSYITDVIYGKRNILSKCNLL